VVISESPALSCIRPVGRAAIGDHRNLRRLLVEFIARRPRLRDARPVGPLRGFPLRTDFPTYRAGGDGFLLVGESLGLVNPVTGEGIDLALESAELAAPVIAAAVAAGDITWRSLAPYGRALNAEYASLFRGVKVLVRLANNPRAICVLAGKAKKKPRLARLIAAINLGVASPWQAFSPLTWWDILT
jgi:menaquinone-9 beta-reductase